MEVPIVCPLCSQPGFRDVDSLWLSLIRASTRQLVCPVCQEVLVGLDKLTIHLVSHSLHGHLVRACLASNPPTTSVTPAKIQTNVGSELSQLPEPGGHVPTIDDKANPPIASYILINFPNSGKSLVQKGCDVPCSSSEVLENNGVRDTAAMSDLCPELDFSSLLSTNSDKATCESDQLTAAFAQYNEETDVCRAVKFAIPTQPLFKEQSVSDELLFSKTSQEMNTNKLCSSKSMTLPTAFQAQQKNNDKLPGKLSQRPTFPELLGDSHKSDMNIGEFGNDMAPATEDPSLSCLMCHLTFRDTNIAMLHQQLVHSQDYLNDSKTGVMSFTDNRNISPKCWQRRCNSLNHNRDIAESPHKYPCHVCNKVFRMRGSLMVHLRVAHSPSGTSLVSQPECSASRTDPSIEEIHEHSSKLSLVTDEDDLVGTCLSGHIENKKLNHQIAFIHSNPFPVKEATIKNTSQFEVCNVTNQISGTDSGPKETCFSAISPSMSPTSSPCSQSAVSGESVGMVYPCNLCNKTYSKESLLTQHLKSHDSKQWECDVCFKSFTTKYFLKKHKRLHTGEMPYTCGICNKSFTFQQSYHKHLLYHSDEKPHSCTECGRAFKELSTLHNHQRIHTGEKPWACETCGKCFRQRVSYLVHRRIHTGAMPYQCVVCLKSFRYKVSQRTHKCSTQPTGDASAQSGEVLQQLLQAPKREEATANSSSSSGLCGELCGEPHLLLKEQLKHLNIKQENPQLMDADKISHESKENQTYECSSKVPSSFSSEPNISNNTDNQAELAPHQATEISAKSSSYCQFFRDLSQDRKQSSDFASSPSPKTGLFSEASTNSCEQGSGLATNKELLPSLESHESVEIPVLPLPLSQSNTSSSLDFNVDLFQDILSMVMSPSPENISSPSSQMRHLSISGGVQNDSDLESGLDLQQLLYGSSDSGRKE